MLSLANVLNYLTATNPEIKIFFFKNFLGNLGLGVIVTVAFNILMKKVDKFWDYLNIIFILFAPVYVYIGNEFESRMLRDLPG